MDDPFLNPNPDQGPQQNGDPEAKEVTTRDDLAHQPAQQPPHLGERPPSPRDAKLRRRVRQDDRTGRLFPDEDHRGTERASENPDDGAPSPAVSAEPATAEEASNLQGALQSALEPEQFQTWFQRSRLIAHEGDAAIVAVPNGFAREWIEKYYMGALEMCVEAVLGAGRRVILREAPESLVATRPIDPRTGRDPQPGHHSQRQLLHPGDLQQDPARTAGSHQDEPTPRPSLRQSWQQPPGIQQEPQARSVSREAQHRPSAQPPQTPWSPLDEGSDFVLNPKCTFDSFVVGPCNRFGHAASIGAAEQPGTAYNPLFLHGRVGVGKTHLLQAFCQAVLDRNPSSRILYLSCETFVNHFVSALGDGDMMPFRGKYRNVDVLVVDDIQLLANKERTQEEFFHTFNSLFNAGKQIVLSSDSPPKDIPTLQDRLVSRFKWGMVTEIEPPCYETRMAIVKRKARERGAELPDDIAQFIAENIEENVRELEGAVTRLFGYTALTNSALTLELARECLAGLIEVRRGAPTVDDIIKVVTDHYPVKLSELQSKRRTKAIAFPRQVAMYLARKVTRHSLEEIGGFFGGRDHTTVLYAVDKIEKLVASDTDFARLAQRFIEQLAAR